MTVKFLFNSLCPLVLGPVESSKLGVVLPHEHVLVDFTKGVVEHPLGPAMGEEEERRKKKEEKRIKGLELTMDNLGVIRRFPYVVFIQ